jgi:IS5 family transposase
VLPNQLRRKLDGKVCTIAGACGPLTGADKALHIWAFTENLYAVKDYDVAELVQHSTKKSVKDLSKKVEEIQRWLAALQGAMQERLK